jgi:hypothetical protein
MNWEKDGYARRKAREKVRVKGNVGLHEHIGYYLFTAISEMANDYHVVLSSGSSTG